MDRHTRAIPAPGADFWDQVWKGDGCWEWAGERTKAGYGLWDGALAHRITFKDSCGDPPPLWHVHHLCENKGCVRPVHLQALHPAKHIFITWAEPAEIALKVYEEGLFYEQLLQVYGGVASCIDLDDFYRRIYGNGRGHAPRRIAA